MSDNKVLVTRNDMEDMADKIRTTLGVSNLMHITEMDSNLNAVNTEVTTQAELIAQLSNILDGKAAGSGGSESSSVSAVNADTIGTFTYKNKTFNFIKGMTWIEFIQSDMNRWKENNTNLEFMISGDGICIYDGLVENDNVSIDGNSYVPKTDLIIDGYNYKAYFVDLL